MSRGHTVLLLLVAVVAGMVALSEPDHWWKAVGARPTGDPPRHPPSPRRGNVIEPDVSLPVPENGSVAAVTVTVPRDDPRTTKPPAATKASSETQPHPLGNLTVFPGRLRAMHGRGGVRVSVEMAGHMREYRRCAHTLRQRVLAPLGASLTVATYPAIGRKRYGVRSDDPSLAAPGDHVAVSDLDTAYGPEHVIAVLIAVQPRVEGTVRDGLPFVDAHFRWAVLQVFMMEVAHNISAAVADRACGGGGVRCSSPEVTIRIRPDAFVVAELSLVRIPAAGGAGAPAELEVRFHCNESMLGRHHGGAAPNASASDAPRETTSLAAPLVAGSLLQAPHHPRLRWVNDPLSDHSLIGHTADYARFAGRMYSAMLGMTEQRLNATYFLRGGTLERIWHRFAVEDAHVALVPCPGWHFLLRDPQAYRNSTLGGDEPSRHRRALVAAIFAITDPVAVGCPVLPNETTTNVGGSYGRVRKKRR